VSYSRSFHLEFVQGGARNASPMLFPETVFNAPASHVAAVFGLTDVNYTLVGDATSATNAIAMAADLIASSVLDQCLVIATEELDWITLEGFARFGFVSTPRSGEARMLPYDRRRNGYLGGEGAVAILLESERSATSRGATPRARLISCDRGFPFHSRREMPQVLHRAIENGLRSASLQWTDVGGVIGSANGTFMDRVEATALAGVVPRLPAPLPVTSPKTAIGESHSTSCMFQIAAAALALQKRQLPPTIGTTESILDATKFRLLANPQPLDRDALLVLCVGFNEQVSVVVLSAA
jgi:3-oxoacyl-(acyl-carrier-protein) synthase